MDHPHPLNDPERLKAVASYEAMDSPPEFEQDTLTELAAQICGFPVALISLMDENRQWFKSNYGIKEITDCPPDVSVCSTTICANDILYVPDLTLDDRFSSLPVVTGPPNLRAYCGVPLVNAEGFALGTLCVMDFEPHELTPSQREAVRRLAAQAMALLELRRHVINRDRTLSALERARSEAETARATADEYLFSIFPQPIAEELKAEGSVQPRYYEMASVLFADFKDSTRLTDGMEPARLIEQLNRNFAAFDESAAENRVVTLRSVGDGYLCAAGIPESNDTHPIDTCLAALRFQAFVERENKQKEMLRLEPWRLRIGINSGPLVAGVVGKKRYTYDVWGTSVNTAARLQQTCDAGRINISASTLHYTRGVFETEPRGQVEVKNLGNVDMYYLNRIKPEFSADPLGVLPNADFWSRLKAHPDL